MKCIIIMNKALVFSVWLTRCSLISLINCQQFMSAWARNSNKSGVG